MSNDHDLDEDEAPPPYRIVIGAAVLAAIAIVLICDHRGVLDLAAFAFSLRRWWLSDGWPWTSGWMSSPGFGGMAAVVAGAFAFAGVRHQARLNAWWQRVEWALGLYVKPEAKDFERRVGAAAIEALVKSRLAKTDEKQFLADVVKAVTLDPLGDGIEHDDWNPEPHAEHAEAPIGRLVRASDRSSVRIPGQPIGLCAILRARRDRVGGRTVRDDGGAA
jgi:hypothetical protein